MTFRAVAGTVVSALVAFVSPAHGAELQIKVGLDLPGASLPYIRQVETFLLPEIAKRVASDSEHTVRFVTPPAATGAGRTDLLSAMERGDLDIAIWCVCTQANVPLPFRFDTLVPFSSPDPDIQLEVKRRILSENPEVLLSLENRFQQRVMAMAVLGDGGVATRHEWNRTGDLAGLSLVSGRTVAFWLEAVGANPIDAMLSDAASRIRDGAASGALSALPAIAALGIREPAPFVVRAGLGAPAEAIVTMSRKFRQEYARLAVQAIDLATADYQRRVNQAARGTTRTALEELDRAGATVTTLSDPQRRLWAEAVQISANERANRMIRDYGVDGIEIMEKYVAYMEQAGHRWPFRYSFKRID
jgi:TRAP-type C4-dicarboxylate transport system substrate-binding protein